MCDEAQTGMPAFAELWMNWGSKKGCGLVSKRKPKELTLPSFGSYSAENYRRAGSNVAEVG